MISIKELYDLFIQHPKISTDTRNLPEGCIFFALKGPNFNGNSYALQALKSGASYAVIDEEVGEDPRLLKTKDVLSTLQELATYHRHQLDVHVLAITGSNGKTTTKELTAAVLSKAFELHYTRGNLNNHIGVPLTLLQLTEEHDFAVVEMGANHQGEIALLCNIAQPDYGLITNIGKAHLEGFGGPEGVKKGKGEMYDYLRKNDGLIFIQTDQPVLHEILRGYDDIIGYGSSEKAEYRGRIVQNDSPYLHIDVIHPFALHIKTQFTGEYNFDNVMAAVATGGYFGVQPEDIRSAIENYIPDNQRSQIIKKGSLTIVLDAYNANPTSMLAAIRNFSRHFSGKKIMALGEMLELGESAGTEHQNIVSEALIENPDLLILVGAAFKPYSDHPKSIYFENSTECSQWIKTNKPQEGNILVKGSRGTKMEIILEGL